MENLTEKETRKLASIELISGVNSIEKADSLEVVTIKGWEVVTKKNEFKFGDKCVYVEIDAILPALDIFEFLKPRNYRIKIIKLRGQISYGICFPLEILKNFDSNFNEQNYIVGMDVTELMQIKKYIAPETQMTAEAKGNFPSFIHKTDEERVQNLTGLLNKINTENLFTKDDIFITEKIDGSSFTCFYVKDNIGNTLSNTFGVCSRNLNLKEGNNKFWNTAVKYDLENKLKKYSEENNMSIAIQGEMYGQGIQSNKYNLNEINLVVFNVFNITNQTYFNYVDLLSFCKALELPTVPFLDIPNDFVFDTKYLLNLSEIKSTLNKNTWAEGIIIRSKNEVDDLRGTHCGRMSFKVINPNFLLAEK